MGQDVQVLFDGKGGLGDAKAPEGPRRRVVGVHSITIDFGVRDLVRAGSVGGGAGENFGGEAGVGPGVANQLRVNSRQRAISFGPSFHSNDRGMSLGMNQHRFSPVIEYLDRLTRILGQQSSVDLPHDVLFATKAAADEGADHPHLFRR